MTVVNEFPRRGFPQCVYPRAVVSLSVGDRRVQRRFYHPVGASPTEAKRLRPRSTGGTGARKQAGEALRQHSLQGECATLQVATYSERRRSLVTRNSGGRDGR